jgi:hypothetical protein
MYVDQNINNMFWVLQGKMLILLDKLTRLVVIDREKVGILSGKGIRCHSVYNIQSKIQYILASY